MDKIILIRKQIKDCKLYLNYLYDSLKKTTNDKEIEKINYGIIATKEVKDILANLINDYENGVGDIRLAEITRKNNKDFEKYGILEKISKSQLETFWKVKSLKSSLDIINENYLSREEIYEYLYDYCEVMKLARKHIYSSFETIFRNYMQLTNQSHKDNSDYYEKMIKIHILFVNIGVLAATKDEDFEHLWPTDTEMGEKTKNDKLSFLKDKFIIPTEATRFKKTHIFNFIRNAFFHSDNNELYKITPDCNFIIISLKNTKPIPFNIKISVNDIRLMSSIMQNYAHHVTAFELENQDKIIINNLFDHYHKCSRELDKTKLVRKQLPDDMIARREEINYDLYSNDANFWSSALFDSILTKYGEITNIKYSFSNDQKRLFHSKFKYFYKYFKNFGMRDFVVPIILNYMAGGIYKLNFLNYEAAIAYTYLFSYKNSVFSIMMDVSRDYVRMYKSENLPKNKKTVFDYITKNKEEAKSIYLYLFDNEERGNYDSVLLFNYVFGTINNSEVINIGGVDYSSEHIRNAFTHGRWRAFVNKNGKRCFYLYDDEDMLVDPDKAYWNAIILYDDLKKVTGEIMNKYSRGISKEKVLKR